MAVGVDSAELRELQLDYLNTTRETAVTIRKHAESLGSRRLFKTAFPILLYLSHQLKGSGGSLGFPLITDIASRMSQELNAFLDDSTPRAAPEELSRSIVALTAAMESEINSKIATLSSESMS